MWTWRLAPVWLLVLVACSQIYLAKTGVLSPWKGGGFGMFSSGDGGGNRNLKFVLIDDRGERPLRVRRRSATLQAAANNPTRVNLDRLAREILPSARRARREPGPLQLRIEVWRSALDATGPRFDRKLWIERSYRVGVERPVTPATPSTLPSPPSSQAPGPTSGEPAPNG